MPSVGGGHRLAGRPVDRARVGRIEALQNREQRGNVRDGARHRPDRVEAPRDREHAADTHPSGGRPQPAHAVERGRNPYRAARVRAERASRQIGAERRARAAARAARDSIEIPRVAAGAVMRILARRAEGELVQAGLAEHHGARLAQPPGNLASPSGRVSAKNPDPAVVRTPAVSMLSLTAIGSPCRSRGGSPRLERASASAAARGGPAQTVM